SSDLFISVKDSDKPFAVDLARRLIESGFEVIATAGTAAHLQEQGVAAEMVHKVRDGQRPHIVDRMIDGAIQLVINTTDTRKAIADTYSLRRTAPIHRTPYITILSGP